MEHRWGRRTAVNLTARVGAKSGSRHLARLSDISVSGAFLRIGLPVDDLHPLRVELAPATGRGSRSVVEAYVVRRTEDGVGIEWSELCPRPLMRLLAQLAPAAIPREATAQAISA